MKTSIICLLLILVLGLPMEIFSQSAHPYLFFSWADTASMNSRIRTPGSPANQFWNLMATYQVQFYMTDPGAIQILDNAWAHQNLYSLGFATVADAENKATYLSQIRKILFTGIAPRQGLLAQPFSSYQGVWFGSWRPLVLSLLYDLLYDDLNPAERESIKSVIVADLYHENADGPRRFVYMGDSPLYAFQNYCNFLPVVGSSVAIAAAALYGDSAYPDAATDLQYMRGRLITDADAFATRMYSGGGMFEGFNYGVFALNHLLPTMYILGRFDGIDYFNEPSIAASLGRVGEYLAYQVLSPPRSGQRFFNNVNDHWISPTSNIRCDGTALLVLAGKYSDGLSQWVFDNTYATISSLLDNTDIMWERNATTPRLVTAILTYDGVAATDPSTALSTSQHFVERGEIVERTSLSPWAGPDDVHFLFEGHQMVNPTSGFFSWGHNHRDKNHFTLYAYGQSFAVDDGYWGYGTADDGRASNHNYIFIGPEQLGEGLQSVNFEDGTFGTVGAESLFISRSSIIDFIHGDAKRAFNYLYSMNPDFPNDPRRFLVRDASDPQAAPYLNPVDHADRFVNFIRGSAGIPPYLVIADDIQKDPPQDPNNHEYRWRLHTGGIVDAAPSYPVTISGNRDSNVKLRMFFAGPYSVTIPSLDPSAQYMTNEQHYMIDLVAPNVVNPFFHTVLVPTKPAQPLPQQGLPISVTNGSVLPLEWGTYTDYSIFRHSGAVTSPMIATDARLSFVRKNSTTSEVVAYSIGKGSYLTFDSVDLVTLDGTATAVVGFANGIIDMSGTISYFRVYAPGVTVVRLNGQSIPYERNGDFVTTPLSALASQNRTMSTQALAQNNQRKVYREASGTLHEVFESAGEVFYRRSTDAGGTWDVTCQLSDGSADNVRPCLSFAGTTAIVVWTRPADDDRLDLLCARSTDGGITWPAASTIQSGFRCGDPGPIPSVSLYSGGSGVVVYRTTGSLRYKLTTNYGATWGSAVNVPGTSASCNMPSSAINTTYWSTKQANLAYATGLPENSPHINSGYYDFQTSSWGTTVDLCSVLPSNYAHHANPSLAVSSSEVNKAIHVAWDAEDTLFPGTRVIVHREGGFRYFPSTYSILHYQSENKPSISGLDADRAWMVYQNNSGTAIWKRYYDGTYWAGGNGTWVGNGRDPQISVGSSSAKYIWTEGTTAPYVIQVSSEALSKAGDPLSYSRALNVIDPRGGGSITVEIGTPTILHGDKRMTEVAFTALAKDSSLRDLTGLLSLGCTSEISMPTDAESVFVPIRIVGISPISLLSEKSGDVTIGIIDPISGLPLTESTSASIEGSDIRLVTTLALSTRALSFGVERSFQIRPQIAGIKIGSETILSLGHIYRNSERVGVAKEGEMTETKEITLKRLLLFLNYPNPFNPSTTIRYGLPARSQVLLTVFNTLGQQVAVLQNGEQEAGYHEVRFDASGLASGVYLYRLQAGDFVQSRKLLLLK